jgi:hypothetical protein
MAGEDANVEIALARSLVERLEEGEVRRHWSRTLHSNDHAEVRDPVFVDPPWLWKELFASHESPAPPRVPQSRSKNAPFPTRHRSTRPAADRLF